MTTIKIYKKKTVSLICVFILNFGIWNTMYTKIVIVRLYYEYDNGTENYLCRVCRSAKASPLCHYTVVKLEFKFLDPWIRFCIYT